LTAGAELVEVVDPAGAVLQTVARSRMRAENLRHRAVYVAVRSRAGALLAHRRAEWKDVWPSRWDLAVGGVLGVGEEWRAAAIRELAEEVGVEAGPADLQDLGPGQFEDGEVRVVGYAYALTHDGPFTFPDGEVQAVRWLPFHGLDAWLAEHRGLLCPDTLAIVLPYLGSSTALW
jgi:isopentenyldiphosphate isomerase